MAGTAIDSPAYEPTAGTIETHAIIYLYHALDSLVHPLIRPNRWDSES
jgi:hypothetical protein